MEIAATHLQAMLDREAIRDCLARLARGEDRHAADLIRACCWPDGSTDYGVFAGDFDAYLAWVVPGADAILCTQHLLGQSVIDLAGDTARVETQVQSYHRIDMGEAQRDVMIGGRYLDIFERREGQWRIARRTMLYDWLQDIGVSADWSQGVMGMAFSAPHFTGRANGDHSMRFFARETD